MNRACLSSLRRQGLGGKCVRVSGVGWVLVAEPSLGSFQGRCFPPGFLQDSVWQWLGRESGVQVGTQTEAGRLRVL